MKKLAFVAAALSAAVAFGGDAITSENIVGYASTPLIKGHKGTGLNFVNVSGAKMTLNDLKVVGYEGSYMAGQISMVQLNSSGDAVGGDHWVWYDGYDEELGQLYGWYLQDGTKGDTVEIGIGEGVWIQADKNDTYSIQVAGQVYNKPVAIQLIKGHALCANPLPSATTLNGAVIAGYGETYMAGQISCVKLDSAGNAVGGNHWVWYDGYDAEIGNLYGWYLQDGTEGDTEPLAVGEAIWVQTDKNDKYTLNFAKIDL